MSPAKPLRAATPKKSKGIPAEAIYDREGEQWELGKRNGKGHKVGEWNYWWPGKHGKVGSMPIALCGDEGGLHVVAASLAELLQIVGADVEPMVSWDAVSYFKAKDEEPSSEIDAYRHWLKNELGLTYAKKPDAIVRKAQSKYGAKFAAWMKPFSVSR